MQTVLLMKLILFAAVMKADNELKKTELELASEKSVCLKALNSDWTDWDYAFFWRYSRERSK